MNLLLNPVVWVFFVFCALAWAFGSVVREDAEKIEDETRERGRRRRAKQAEGRNRAEQDVMNEAYVVRAEWDPGAGVWVAMSDDVPGLITEAETIETLDTKLQQMIPDQLATSGCLPTDGVVVIELRARRFTKVSSAPA